MFKMAGVLLAAVASLCAVLQAEESSVPATTLPNPESALNAALARELTTMWTRDADRLVGELELASRDDSSPPLTFLLAIAHAETNGKILTISTAGAVGLAQATPIAYRAEGFNGKLFVTSDYLEGARAYVQKKPLGDAAAIAEYLAGGFREGERRYARELHTYARQYLREGVGDLEYLAPWATSEFLDRIAISDRHNEEALDELAELIDRGDAEQLKKFAKRVRREYRSLKESQARLWTKYQRDLVIERERILREHFPDEEPEVVIRTRAWEAGDVLARELDERFSGPKMALFLVAHLRRKIGEAKQIAVAHDDLDEVAAALYNGGSLNVYRMRAGLIGSLRETERYMKKVPATMRRLDRIVELSRIDPFTAIAPGGR